MRSGSQRECLSWGVITALCTPLLAQCRFGMYCMSSKVNVLIYLISPAQLAESSSNNAEPKQRRRDHTAPLF